MKFGISFTATFFNQAGALVHVYTDGSVQVNHGGTEMGQGLHTKVCQIVADELGIPFAKVRISATDTSKVPNASATAASSGTDLNGRAAQFAARQVRQKLAEYVADKQNCRPEQVIFAQGQVSAPDAVLSWEQAVDDAYHSRVQLWSDGFYRTPKIHYDKHTLTGRPFYYFSYGAACTEVAIDTLTGENRVLKVDILHDVGTSINPAIDIGQIEGGFIQGMGWLTTEQLVWNDQGYLATHAPSTYKIPATGDVPEHFKVDLWPEANREDNVGGSKAVGEPPFMLAISVWEALRDAAAAARGDGKGADGCAGDGGEACCGPCGLDTFLPPLPGGGLCGGTPAPGLARPAQQSIPPAPLYPRAPGHYIGTIAPNPCAEELHVTPARPLHLPRCAHLRTEPGAARTAPHGGRPSARSPEGRAHRLAALDDPRRARRHRRRTRDRAATTSVASIPSSTPSSTRPPVIRTRPAHDSRRAPPAGRPRRRPGKAWTTVPGCRCASSIRRPTCPCSRSRCPRA